MRCVIDCDWFVCGVRVVMIGALLREERMRWGHCMSRRGCVCADVVWRGI